MELAQQARRRAGQDGELRRHRHRSDRADAARGLLRRPVVPKETEEAEAVPQAAVAGAVQEVVRLRYFFRIF